METIVRGYNVYGAVWEAPVGQILPCQREGGNIHDPYASLLSRKVLLSGSVLLGIPKQGHDRILAHPSNDTCY